jgi:hypothetical protein
MMIPIRSRLSKSLIRNLAGTGILVKLLVKQVEHNNAGPSEQRDAAQDVDKQVRINRAAHLLYQILLSTVDLTLQSVEQALSTADKYQFILEKTNEALLAYVDEFKKIKKFVLDIAAPANGDVNLEE